MYTNREMYTYHKEFELVHTLAVKVERGILKFHRIDPSTDGEGHVLRVKGKIAQVHSGYHVETNLLGHRPEDCTSVVHFQHGWC